MHLVDINRFVGVFFIALISLQPLLLLLRSNSLISVCEAVIDKDVMVLSQDDSASLSHGMNIEQAAIDDNVDAEQLNIDNFLNQIQLDLIQYGLLVRNSSDEVGLSPSSSLLQGERIDSSSFSASNINNDDHKRKEIALVVYIVSKSDQANARKWTQYIRSFLLSSKVGFSHDELDNVVEWCKSSLNTFLESNRDYISEYQKRVDVPLFSVDEFEFRSLIFGLELMLIHAHNNLSTISILQPSFLSLLTPTEMKSTLTRSKASSNNEFKLPINNFNSSDSVTTVNQTWDLRNLEIINHVVHQGICGSGYAIAALGSLSGLFAKESTRLFDLSVQQVIDCNHYDDGCNGGAAENVFRYAYQLSSGITTEGLYPNQFGLPSFCDIEKEKKGFVRPETPPIYASIKSDKELESILLKQPVVVSIQASGSCFKNYKSGILTPEHCNCSSSEIDHSMLAVGFGVENDTSFWILRNSWGTNWGEKGFVRISRLNESTNYCGMYTNIIYPLNIEKDISCSFDKKSGNYCGDPAELRYEASSNGACVPSMSGTYTKSNCVADSSTQLPAWAYGLIGIAIGFGLVGIIVLGYLCCGEGNSNEGAGRRLGGARREPGVGPGREPLMAYTE